MMNKSRVFISYSREDQPLVQSVVDWLKDSEFRSALIDDPTNWDARGDDRRSFIADKIRHADTVLLLWSDCAAKSPWVQYEVGIAQAFDVPIRVLLAQESTSKLPAGLAKTDVTKLDATTGGSTPASIPSDSVRNASVSTALEDLKQQYQRIEHQIQHVSEILNSKKLERATVARRKRTKGSLTAAPRKRITPEKAQDHRKQ